jgi:hypothetical protein
MLKNTKMVRNTKWHRPPQRQGPLPDRFWSSTFAFWCLGYPVNAINKLDVGV